jgi:hypothetical protein
MKRNLDNATDRMLTNAQRHLALNLVRAMVPTQHARNSFTPLCARRQGDRIRRRRLIFAGRLGGLSGAGVADVPARRIGIHLWQTHFWRKPLINL